ncbi:hypothetical protein [Sulfurimonas sp. RIFOXYB12_FULL_35_9]|uniref:hypothetical protein n=1 Tax=Sulfurimonas sp. RIFOXYB12_FULL_35_9 TaxID=1802256 RepID=UPI0008BE71B2|nr:hypothetical protein [Sulfurimonas sp. RIFOXYB12_FULL_35_9]OHE06478.1 MAG: hypothetical protein A2345_07960 [Sulfurimonas sp. RIFOXYB12_FULL_35_9]
MSTYIKNIKDFICFHQGCIIEFEFGIASLHKELRKEWDGEKREEVLKEKLIGLYDESSEKLQIILEKTFEQIKAIYGENIRFSVKTIEKNEYENLYITDYYRENMQEIPKELKRARDHTPFANILFDNEDKYISNDLEEDFKNAKYRNPRVLGNKIGDLNKGDVEWKDCWIKHSGDTELKYYNSLLVMPLTLKNNNFMENFNKKFKTDAIWGFFCLDSEEKNAFADEALQDIGRIMADMLSIYFIFLYEHTENSETFNLSLDYLISE